MSQVVILGALELGGIFAVLSLGLYISYKVLNIPDLTVDGSFTLGTAISAVFTMNSMPYLGILASFVFGLFAGMVTGLLITKLKIMPLLSGILTMTGLYSINLMIMNNTPTISLFDQTTIFSSLDTITPYSKLIVIYVIVILIVIILNLFLKTQLGLSLRACGDNEAMVRASSIDTDKMKVFIKKEKIIFQLIAVVFGAIFYRAILTVALQLGLPSGYLKLLSAILVVIAIASTNGAFKRKKRRK